MFKLATRFDARFIDLPPLLARDVAVHRLAPGAPTMSRSLADWLDYQQQVHPAGIALGLDRVREVALRLGIGRPARQVITVAGTNGKGSTVAFIDAIARAAGHRVGCYTSPHLLRYNERVRIDGSEVDDAILVAAFERIETARGDVPLTYFEFGTLAALLIFADAGLDLAVLEVGLGGRLDAVNIIDADVAVVTTVALDHMEWLGTDRETIGFEKAGILRNGRPAVLGERMPAQSVLDHAHRIGAPVRQAGQQFDWQIHAEGGMHYRDADGELELPAPALAAACQPGNAATALCALRQLGERLPIPAVAARAGIASAQLAGRMQRIPGAVEVVLDVAHNPQAAEQLAAWLRSHPARGRTHAVFSALGDKDLPQLVAPMSGLIDSWRLAGLADAGPRGLTADALWSRLESVLADQPCSRHAHVADALAHALAQSAAGDRIVVFGSFHTVAEALQTLPQG
jgi:dihydrofolate synthase / folylpolyglutamate synthase